MDRLEYARVTWAELAERVAREAHLDQRDKNGDLYIFHPQRVADRVQGDVPKAVAWLHDVLEDTPYTEDDLLYDVGFPLVIVEAVVALTHLLHEPNTVYWARVRQNKLARQVKLADIADNTDPKRMARLDEKTRTRLQLKYERALEALNNG